MNNLRLGNTETEIRQAFLRKPYRCCRINPSCHLPKEVDATSKHKESDLDLKAFGSDGVNRFW